MNNHFVQVRDAARTRLVCKKMTALRRITGATTKFSNPYAESERSDSALDHSPRSCPKGRNQTLQRQSQFQ